MIIMIILVIIITMCVCAGLSLIPGHRVRGTCSPRTCTMSCSTSAIFNNNNKKKKKTNNDNNNDNDNNNNDNNNNNTNNLTNNSNNTTCPVPRLAGHAKDLGWPRWKTRELAKCCRLLLQRWSKQPESLQNIAGCKFNVDSVGIGHPSRDPTHINVDISEQESLQSIVLFIISTLK